MATWLYGQCHIYLYTYCLRNKSIAAEYVQEFKWTDVPLGEHIAHFIA